MARNRMSGERIALIVVVILLIGVVSYMGYGKYNSMVNARAYANFQQGAQYGYTTAINQLIVSAQNCKPVSVYSNQSGSNQSGNNISMQLIDVSCLKAVK